MLQYRSATLCTFLHTGQSDTNPYIRKHLVTVCSSPCYVRLITHLYKSLLFVHWQLAFILRPNMTHTTKPSHHVLSKFFVASRESNPAHVQNESTFPLHQRLCIKYTQVLSSPPSEYQKIMLWVACYTAFFGFLRVGEMTSCHCMCIKIAK